MPQVAPYIPTRQADFTAWLANFSTLITATPAAFGLLAADATTIAAYNTAWVLAYTPVTSPNTRTPATVANKDAEYASIVPQLRQYAQRIANNAGVSNENKIAVGVNPKTSTPSPITAPASNPVLTIQSQTVGTLILRYRDSAASVSVKSKPYGVTGCQIRAAVSQTPVTDPAALPIVATATKSPFLLDTSRMPKGSTVYLSAFWVTRKQQLSPAAPIITAIVT